MASLTPSHDNRSIKRDPAPPKGPNGARRGCPKIWPFTCAASDGFSLARNGSAAVVDESFGRLCQTGDLAGFRGRLRLKRG